MQAHPSLPTSQQIRINAWIEKNPTLKPYDMPTLIELARNLDRINRIINQINDLSHDDLHTHQSLTDLLELEKMRVLAVNRNLGLDLGPLR